MHSMAPLKKCFLLKLWKLFLIIDLITLCDLECYIKVSMELSASAYASIAFFLFVPGQSDDADLSITGDCGFI